MPSRSTGALDSRRGNKKEISPSPAPPTRSAVLPHLGADGHRLELLTCGAFAGFPFVPHPGVPGQDSTAHLRWQTLVLRRGTGDTTPISRTSCNSVAHQRSQSVAPRMQSLKSKKDVIEEAWQTKKSAITSSSSSSSSSWSSSKSSRGSAPCPAQRSFVALWLLVGALVQCLLVVACGRLG